VSKFPFLDDYSREFGPKLTEKRPFLADWNDEPVLYVVDYEQSA
jgi:hypothetical protein